MALSLNHYDKNKSLNSPTFFERLFNNFSFVKGSLLRDNQDKIKSSLPITSLLLNNNNHNKANTWDQAIAEAEKLVQHKGGSYIDPIKLVGTDIIDLTKNIKRLLGSKHPLLDTISKYYFLTEGKRIRPLIVLLMSQATSIADKNYNFTQKNSYKIIDEQLSPINFKLDDTTTIVTSPLKNPNNDEKDDLSALYYPSVSPTTGVIILPTQRRLAEITEMIHTASLLHDDVIDLSETRRNQPSANKNFGNKMAILAGDFLLARASVALARLRNPEVIELLATVIANLVEGEFMQLSNMKSSSPLPISLSSLRSNSMSTFEYYMEKTYMKTASLIAKSCRAASILGGSTIEVSDIAYNYGRNIGLAFQLVDDMLDFVVTSKDQLGKPIGADLKLGLATAPVLYAWEEYSEIGPLIKRKFSEEGDVEMARELVYRSDGIEKTKLLASSHCQKAITGISQLPESDARNALIQLAHSVLIRKK